mgnify:FL=1
MARCKQCCGAPSQQSIWLYEHAGLLRALMRHSAAPCSQAFVDNSAQTTVDLTLATTYVPGVRALVETLVLLTVVQIFLAADVASHSQVVTVAAAVLYTVRSLWHSDIVDASGCAVVVLVALTVNTWRVELEDGQILVHHSVDLVWMLVSLAILLHDVLPIPLLHAQVWMHTIVTAVFIAMHAFMALAFEDNFTQYLRSAGFVLLSVFWTYTSYLKMTPGSVTLHECLHRFVLMLLAEWYIALLFLILSMGGLLFRVMTFQPGSRLHTMCKPNVLSSKNSGGQATTTACSTPVQPPTVDADTQHQLKLALEARGLALGTKQRR